LQVVSSHQQRQSGSKRKTKSTEGREGAEQNRQSFNRQWMTQCRTWQGPQEPKQGLQPLKKYDCQTTTCKSNFRPSCASSSHWSG
jgi:hypothetical protein